MFRSYAAPRSVLYGLTWVFSLILLGLTGYRIHHTKSLDDGFAFYDPIIAELLVTSIFALLWVPVALAFLFKRSTSEASSGGLLSESAGVLFLWIMYLIGAAISTHKWPSAAVCGSGKQCDVLITINAFSWMIFGFLSIIFTVILMHHASASAAAAPAEERKTAAPAMASV